jgi:hypothetical protein
MQNGAILLTLYRYPPATYVILAMRHKQAPAIPKTIPTKFSSVFFEIKVIPNVYKIGKKTREMTKPRSWRDEI